MIHCFFDWTCNIIDVIGHISRKKTFQRNIMFFLCNNAVQIVCSKANNAHKNAGNVYDLLIQIRSGMLFNTHKKYFCGQVGQQVNNRCFTASALEYETDAVI